MTAQSETERRPWVFGPRHIFGFDMEGFLDRVSMIVIREGKDVEIRDYEYYPKDYMGPKINVLTLADARERVSPQALERRIASKRLEIEGAQSEIGRLEGIRTELYGEQVNKATSTS